MKYRYILFSAIAVFLVFNSCKKDTTKVDENVAPEIPPASTFSMDYSDFITSGSAVQNDEAEMMTKNNKLFAAINVGFWSSAVYLVMVVPSAAFAEAFNHEPVQQDDGSWLWSYNFMVAGTVYTAELYGGIENLKIIWEMYITKQNGFSKFLWYEGESNLTITSGDWILYTEPANPEPFLQIDWNRALDNSTGDLKYTNIIPADADSSSYIYFEVNTDTSYNRRYDIYSRNHNNTTEIMWHRPDNNGRVRDPLHFGDDLWQCWDSAGNDVNCN